MQTFVPYGPNFEANAQVLDYRRLGKQRVEAYQILKALEDPDYGWQNHPAVKMWRGYSDALAIYAQYICLEWLARGYRDSVLEKIYDYIPTEPYPLPSWLSDPALMLSHKSNLIRKDPDFYGRLWPQVPNDLPYIWPV